MSQEILVNLSKDKELMTICKGIAGGSYLWEDLFQDTILVLYEKPKEVIEDSINRGKLKALAIKIMLNLWSDERRLQNRTYEYYSNSTPAPQFSSPMITTNIGYWEQVIKTGPLENAGPYNITEITPESIKILSVLEKMKLEDTEKQRIPYRSLIFNYYLKLGSERGVARYTKINWMSINRTIKDVKKLIRQCK